MLNFSILWILWIWMYSTNIFQDTECANFVLLYLGVKWVFSIDYNPQQVFKMFTGYADHTSLNKFYTDVVEICCYIQIHNCIKIYNRIFKYSKIFQHSFHFFFLKRKSFERFKEYRLIEMCIHHETWSIIQLVECYYLPLVITGNSLLMDLSKIYRYSRLFPWEHLPSKKSYGKWKKTWYRFGIAKSALRSFLCSRNNFIRNNCSTRVKSLP